MSRMVSCSVAQAMHFFWSKQGVYVMSARHDQIKKVRRGPLRPLTLPKKGSPPFDGVASLVVDRGAGAGLGRKLWSSPAGVL